jgi:hypothetical protein
MCLLQQLEPAAPKHNSRWKSKWERCTVQVQSSVYHLNGRLQGSVAATMSVGKQAPICCTSCCFTTPAGYNPLFAAAPISGPPYPSPVCSWSAHLYGPDGKTPPQCMYLLPPKQQ